jgi:hypothetical protein
MSHSSTLGSQRASFWAVVSLTDKSYFLERSHLNGGEFVHIKAFKNDNRPPAISVALLKADKSIIQAQPTYGLVSTASGFSELTLKITPDTAFISLNSGYAPVSVFVQAFNYVLEPTLNPVKYSNSQTITLDSPHTAVLMGGGGGGGVVVGGRSNGGGSGYITTGTVNAGTYSLVIGGGGGSGNSGGSTTFASLTAAGGVVGAVGGGGQGGSGGGGPQSAGGFNGNSGINGAAGSGVAPYLFIGANAALHSGGVGQGGGIYGGGAGSDQDGAASANGTGGGGAGTYSTNVARSGGGGFAGALYLLKIG